MTTRVLHVIARMNVGGTARYVGDLVQYIDGCKLATGHVQGFEIEDPIVDQIPVIRVKHLGRKVSLLSDFRAWAELRKIVSQFQPEIVHTHTFKAGLIGRLVRGKHKRIHTFHGHLFEDKSFSSFQKILITVAERVLARKTDLFVSVGKKVGFELRAQKIGLNKTWVSIPPGVDELPRIEKRKARADLGIASSGLVVGWMARMESVKNPQLFVEVAKMIKDIDFVMAGGGSLINEVRSISPENLQVIGWTEASKFKC